MFWGKPQERVYEAASGEFSVKVIETFEDTYYSLERSLEVREDEEPGHAQPPLEEASSDPKNCVLRSMTRLL